MERPNKRIATKNTKRHEKEEKGKQEVEITRASSPIQGRRGTTHSTPLSLFVAFRVFCGHSSSYPLMTPMGRMRATLREMPAWCTTSTTSSTFLYAFGCSSARPLRL